MQKSNLFADERIKGSKYDIDKLLNILVIDHEMKKLNARTRPSKNSKKGKNGTSHSDED